MLSRFILISTLFGLLLLGACSESTPKSVKSSTDNNDPNAEALTNTNFLPFEIRSFSPGKTYTSALQVMNSQKSGADGVQSLAGSGTAINVLDARFNQGSFNTTELTLTNYRLDTLLYTQDKLIYKLDLFDIKIPQPLRLSNEFQANIICHERDIWVEDFANFNNSRYVYYIASNCQGSTGEWHMVNLSMDETQSPVNLLLNINYFVTSVINHDSGALKGWLIVNREKYLNYFDTDFTVNKFVTLNNQNVLINNNAFFLMRNKQKQLLLSLDEAIIWYNTQTNLIDYKLNVLQSALASQIYLWRSDGVYLYFTINHFATDGETVSSSTLHRVSLENPQQAELLSNETGKIDNIEAGFGGVVFSVNGELKVSKPSITTLTRPANYNLSLNAQGQSIFYVTEDTLMAEYVRSDEATIRLIKIQNTSGQIDETLLDNYLVGVTYQNVWHMDETRQIDKIIVEAGKLGSGSRNLLSLVPSAYPTMLNLGTLPIDNNPRFLERFFALGHDDILVQGTFNSSAEILFIDAEKANSLTRVTDNQSIERTVNF